MKNGKKKRDFWFLKSPICKFIPYKLLQLDGFLLRRFFLGPKNRPIRGDSETAKFLYNVSKQKCSFFSYYSKMIDTILIAVKTFSELGSCGSMRYRSVQGVLEHL